jgi:hypothetical protein
VSAFSSSLNRRKPAQLLKAPCCASLAVLATLSAGAVAHAQAPSVPAIAPTTQTAPSHLPAYPPYNPDAQKDEPVQAQPPSVVPPDSIAIPVPGQAPVVAAKPTAEHPNVALNPYNPYAGPVIVHDSMGSTYIPMDSWMYPALLRLYSLGYVDTAFLALRPYTRRSVLHMLEKSESDIRFDNNEQAVEILDKLYYELRDEPSAGGTRKRGLVYGLDSAYVGIRGVGGTVLRDSYHLGQSFNNDYGRPYSNGFNSYNGLSAIGELGPFSVYVRGEYQHAPSYDGYDLALTQKLSTLDGIVYGSPTANLFGGTNSPQPTIPTGTINAKNNFTLLEATFSAHAIGHEISFGKSDAWTGPGLGGAMLWSNNAENIYSFRINRIEPLHIPFVSRLIGDIRYDFFVGSLKGHTYPQDPWAHSESIVLSPTKNFQIGFGRTIVWGGKGHEPITLHTFLKGFFDTSDTTASEKFGRDDPGARFSSVNFSYRLPFLRNRVTLYTDSVTHDDVFPISAPRRAGWRPGIFLSQLPYAPKFDFRVEGVYTDYVTSRSTGGQGIYYETVQRQAYTNNGFIMGDWIGREAKGGQAWLTYHLSGNESVTVQYLRKKNAKDFIAGGTTQDIFRVDLVKRLTRDVELNAWFQSEQWKAPIWKAGQQSSTTGAFQLTWYPGKQSGL